MKHARLAWVAAAALTWPAVVIGACSTESGSERAAGTGGNAGGGGSGTGDGGDLFMDTCTPGQPCGSDGVCAADGTCCEATLCGASCCVGDEVCSFEQCHVPGNDCVDATDCGPDEYCEYGLGEPTTGQGGAGANCQGAAELPSGKCMPKPPECGPGQTPGEDCIEICEYIPPVGQFNPVEKFTWGTVGDVTHNVMMAPIVTQLDDDNCDGQVTERDIPDIVFFTFNNSDYNNNGGNSSTLRAISIIDGVVTEKWSTATAGDHPGRSIAAGDVHPNAGNEIVVCSRDADQRVRLYGADGNELWTSEVLGTTCFMPSIADMDQDGNAEIITRQGILNGIDGSLKHSFSPANFDNVIVSDVTGNGVLDVVSTSRVYDATGTAMVDASGVVGGRHAAVGDLDKDGVPEIVVVDFLNHELSLWHVDPNATDGYTVIRSGIDINGSISPNPCCQSNPNSAGCNRGGGPPTIADFNGDGFPDVGLAGGIGYGMFDGVRLMDTVNFTNAQTIAWLKQTQDCSSAQTGSSVFDFDGDGNAEVVYADEVTLHIYDGTTGDDLVSICNTSGTLYEYPLVADVDSDGHADIVVASNHYSSLNCGPAKTTGIRVFGDFAGEWVRTRRIWNQHAYHVTNVNEDGTIPAVEASNWADPSLNNFRQNVQPLGEFSAPDLVVDVFPRCSGEYAIVGRVRNIGQASVEAGVVVGFYEGDPAAGGVLLGQGTTEHPLYSLESEDVVLVPSSIPTSSLYAVVDDGMPMHAWHECRTDNNTGGPADPACGAN